MHIVITKISLNFRYYGAMATFNFSILQINGVIKVNLEFSLSLIGFFISPEIHFIIDLNLNFFLFLSSQTQGLELYSQLIIALWISNLE